MKRIFLTVTVLFCLLMVSADVVHAEEDGKKRRGLLSGLLEQVGSTVDETLNAVGGIVGSAVEGVDKTVDDTVSFTKETVETLVDPKEKRPVSNIVGNTVEHVGKTVENVEPILKNTTKTVETVTTEVVGVTEELPKLPVVTPVVEEVGKVVNKTSDTLTGTIDKTVDKTVETVKDLPATVEEVIKSDDNEAAEPEKVPAAPGENTEKPMKEPVASAEPERPTKPAIPQKPVKPEIAGPNDGQSGTPVVEQDDSALQEVGAAVSEPIAQTETETAESVNENSSQPAVEPEAFEQETDPSAEEAIGEIPTAIQTQMQTVDSGDETVDQPAVTAVEQSTDRTESPAIPPTTKAAWHDTPVTMTTATTSVATASVASGGFSDFVTGIVNWLDTQVLLEGRKWIHSTEIMRNQWTHAPPGQPPQQTPFLQINNQN